MKKDPLEGWVNEYWIAYQFEELKAGPLSSAIIRLDMLIDYMNNHSGPDQFVSGWKATLIGEKGSLQNLRQEGQP